MIAVQLTNKTTEADQVCRVERPIEQHVSGWKLDLHKLSFSAAASVARFVSSRLIKRSLQTIRPEQTGVTASVLTICLYNFDDI